MLKRKNSGVSTDRYVDIPCKIRAENIGVSTNSCHQATITAGIEINDPAIKIKTIIATAFVPSDFLDVAMASITSDDMTHGLVTFSCVNDLAISELRFQKNDESTAIIFESGFVMNQLTQEELIMMTRDMHQISKILSEKQVARHDH